jgi:sec-independent protein translocase protein TatA
MGLGTGEIVIIAFTLVVIFSASRMGALGNAFGKFVYSFRRASQGQDLVDVTPRKPGGNEKAGRSRPS